MNNTTGSASKARQSIHSRRCCGEFVTGGGMVQMVAGLDGPVQDWLIDGIPEGATLTDLLRAMIIDAYHEENEGAEE